MNHAVSSNRPRRRLWLGILVIGVIGLGLASRKYPWLFPALLGKYPGDALWALMMVFFGWAWVAPGAPTRALAFLGLATSGLVEFSQLYQAPWINAIRSTTAGHLVLGSTFSWLDLLAYAVGVAVGVAMDLGFFGSVAEARRRT
jgi:hypothetical protein